MFSLARWDGKMNLDFLALFKPDDTALLRRISRHIDDAMLQCIARMDPVSKFEEHMTVLRKIRRTATVDKPLTWIPGEVLNFALMHEPDEPGTKLIWEFRGMPGHWVRAFCCAALLRAYGDVEMREIEHIGYGVAVIQLLESLRRLDAKADAEAMAALAWHIARMNEESHRHEIPSELAFFGIGLLSLAVRSRNAVPDAVIIDLTEWLIAKEQKEFDGGYRGDNANHWLFRTGHIDMLDEKWLALGAELAAFDATGHCGDAVRAIGDRMAAE
jgi:hypothetical protein